MILEFLKNNKKCYQSVIVTSNSNELDMISSYIEQHSSSIEVLVPCDMRISNGKLIHSNLILIVIYYFKWLTLHTGFIFV